MDTIKSLIRAAMLLAAVSLAPAASAQAGLPPATEDVPRGPSFRISTWGEWQGPQLYLSVTNDWKPVELIDMGYSPAMPFNREQPLVFCRKAKTEKGEGYLPVVSVAIPREITSPLVLLVPDGKGSARPFIIDLAPSAFPWGSYQFVNFTEQAFDSAVGNDRFALSSGKSHLVNPQKNENTRLPITVRAGLDGNWTTVYSTMVINRPQKRMLLFFHPKKSSSGAMTIETRCLVDFRQSEGI